MSKWARARKYILAALARSPKTHTEQDIIDGIDRKELNLWMPEDNSAAIVSVIQEHPQAKHLMMWLAGGNLSSVLDGFDLHERVAADHGCNAILLCGRKGWERALKSRGYRFVGVVLSKEIKK